MQKFINLSPEKSKGLDVIISKNAKQLKRDALLLAENNKSFSSATSLLILSSEEMIKAILVLLHSEEYDVYLIENSKKFFFDHKIRHEVSKIIDLGISLMESIVNYEENKSTEILNTNIEWLNSIVNGFSRFVQVSMPFLNSFERIELLKEFNDIKNNGLYTGYYDRVFIPKEEVKETDFNKVIKLVERIFQFYRTLKILFNPRLVNRYPEEDVLKLKDELRIGINKLLKVDLKEIKKIIK